MSTVTKIKGVFQNSNLPVLTDLGLKDYYVGKFYNRCKEAGTTLTSGQITALESFIESLRDNGIIDNVAAMYPFFGTSSNKATVQIPLIGDTPVVYPSTYTGYTIINNNVIGPKSIQAQTGKIGNAKNGFAIAMSLKITSVSGITAPYRLVQMGLDSGSFYQYRLDGTPLKNKIYQFNSNSQEIASLNPSLALDEQDVIGNVYMLEGIGDVNSEYTYSLNHKVNGVYKYNASDYAASIKAVSEDSAFKITGSSVLSGITYTSMALFYKVPSANKAKQYLDALQILMNALGKEATE